MIKTRRVNSEKTIRLFFISAAVVLFVTAAAKFIASGGSARVLQLPDPVLAMPSFFILRLAGSVELAVGAISFSEANVKTKALVMGWLGLIFAIYRFGLLYTGQKVSCPCLGNLSDALRMSPHTADAIALAILAYILIGSCVILYFLRRSARGEQVARQWCLPQEAVGRTVNDIMRR
jgi:hypothetical protein